MPKRSSKPSADPNKAAASILAAVTGDPIAPVPEKNAAAVELGRRGGLKGGAARAAALSPEERKRIAQEAARKRWGPPKDDGVE
jgi:hypothetical protein